MSSIHAALSAWKPTLSHAKLKPQDSGLVPTTKSQKTQEKRYFSLIHIKDFYCHSDYGLQLQVPAAKK
jgi:hypothetical protein